ncbi:MAG: hypothetical protein HY800_04185 [Ignavibacteriales bacterium]|nr:hypothetical protein [Ignavibacteriales bacterium]
MKKEYLILLLILLISIAANASGQDRGFGAGIIIGEPTGVSLKGWLTQKTAIDVGLAWSFVEKTSFHVHADYLIHSFDVFETEEEIPLYYGIGGRIKTADNKNARFGLRMVGGIGYLFKDVPFDLFIEIAPILDLAPKTELSMNAGFGARFFFH